MGNKNTAWIRIMKSISIVIPCYNEEQTLPIYFKAVDEVLPQIKDYQVDFVLVNDGSKDNTLSVMNDIYLERNDVTIVNLSRNYGQNAAFTAGLKASKGDYVITMDSDLQDPVTLLPAIAEKFTEGYDAVAPHRSNRQKDSFFKRKTAAMFYSFINKIEGKHIIQENVNCFRGMSRKVVDKILELTESDRYLLHEVPLIGFKTCMLNFTREARSAGESKYTLKKLVNYALGNISAGTSNPLYVPIKFGAFSSFCTFFASLIMTVFYVLCYPTIGILGEFTLVQTLFFVSIISFSTSLIIFFIGVLGIYLHNILINTRNRPTYIIDTIRRPEDKE